MTFDEVMEGAVLLFEAAGVLILVALAERQVGPGGRRTGQDRLGPGCGRGRNLPHPRLLARAVTRPLKIRPEAVLGVTFPPGRVPTESWAGALRAITGSDWTADPLWICTVRTDDARRVVLGRKNAPKTDLATAVAASAAIPGYFQPVEIDGRSYVDGGVHSPTNADILRKEDLDLVLISSPMSTNIPMRWKSPARPWRLSTMMGISSSSRRTRPCGVATASWSRRRRAKSS